MTSLDDDIDNLTRIPLFAIFEPGALRMLAFSSETRLLRAGDALFRRGEESDCGYILTMGAIALLTHDDGRSPAHVLRPWALIGEIALVTPSLRPVTARALEPSTVLRISRALFHQILEQHPSTAARARDFFRERLVDFSRNAAAGLGVKH
ncbi:MAG: cyclic nucleotide-binding protein [Methylocystis sp.]|nr:MAG: cyclic nucleotide-binding protein [Methylocystis sp.]